VAWGESIMTSVSLGSNARTNGATIEWSMMGLLLLTLIAAYWSSWNSMRVVWDTPTYTHGYFVPLVSAWLAWRQRAQLATAPLSPWPWALVGIACCGLLWLAGDLAGVSAARHFAIVGMIPCLVALIFGHQITRRLAFPLAFLIFAVPFGDFMLPMMMDWTAAITIALVSASGVPIFREGLNFMLPTGSWSIIEECSGQRYLVAALPLACLFAYITFRLNRTRVLFVIMTALVALAANWMRAYLIVMIGHLSGMSLATGFDHLIYGWLFFGLVMALIFWIGSRWRESTSAMASLGSSQTVGPCASAATRARTITGLLGTAAMGLALLAAWPVAGQQLSRVVSRPLDLDTVFAVRESFELMPHYRQEQGFKPAYLGMRQELYAAVQDHRAMLWVGKYEAQGNGNEMVGANQVTSSRPGNAGWRIVGARVAGFEVAGARPAEYELMLGGDRLIVWQWFYIDGIVTHSPPLAKLLTAWRVARGRGDQTLAIFLWTPAQGPLRDAQTLLQRASGLVTDALERAPKS
jgi:exosortase A